MSIRFSFYRTRQQDIVEAGPAADDRTLSAYGRGFNDSRWLKLSVTVLALQNCAGSLFTTTTPLAGPHVHLHQSVKFLQVDTAVDTRPAVTTDLLILFGYPVQKERLHKFVTADWAALL